MSDRKAVIKNADMSEEMQQDAVECATQALEKYNIEKDIAAYIKKEFDKKYNPTWHCIVGRNFGSYVTHETKHFIYFYLGQRNGWAVWVEARTGFFWTLTWCCEPEKDLDQPRSRNWR
uniref:Dynein light chain n=1 Tax=Astyanax mexicanus TaxID=7994 RepID=A0A3B1J618_ASTMX